MSLAAQLRAIHDRAATDLIAAHDYYADTRVAWEVVRWAVARGRRLTRTNDATGTVTTGAELAGRSDGYVKNQLAVATFQTFLAVAESFLADFLRAYFLAYPGALKPTEPVPFDQILTAADKPAILAHVADRKIYGLFYERPAQWFRFVDANLKLGCPNEDEIGRFSEAKATRDAWIHNRGVATAAYEDKAGKFRRVIAGELIDLPEPYHREVWELIRKIVADMTAAAVAKFP